MQKNGTSIICDLRKIPLVAFGTKQITDLVVATPTDEDEEVLNLLGRSFIDAFYFGVDQDIGRVFFKKRNVIINPDFSFSHIAYSVT